jgi:hypothetical protein
LRLSSAAARHALLLTLVLVPATRAVADEPLPEPLPSPTPPGQDELDFQGRSSLVFGSGARALGMAGAFLARADDATAASWNPAGLSYLRLPEISLVATRNDFGTNVTGPGATTALQDDFLGYSPDFLAAAVPFSFAGGRLGGVAQLSFQRTFSFFSGTRDILRADNPPLRHTGSGGFDVLALGTGIQLSRQLRVGATVNRWINGFVQTRERFTGRPTRQVNDFDLDGWNFNLGLIWTPIESLNLGLVFKTPFRGKVSLSRSRVDFPDDPDKRTTNVYTSDDLAQDYGRDVRLDFPGALGVGMSWRPRSGLTVSADYTRTFWSDAAVYNYFFLEAQGEPAPPETLFDELSWPSLGQEQVDTEQVRIGVEYVIVGRTVKIPLRAGVLSDRQYFRASGVVPRFWGFSLGSGVAIGPVLFDVAYIHESGSYASDPDLDVNARIDRVYMSVIYRHGGR